MTEQVRLRRALVVCALALCFRACFGVKDCTGADCPLLDNCIEEVLERGACCATCLKLGCRCEGYQYYDCISAGFRNGKVPAGESYLVDFGSTECTCPAGGGRISCRFIPCPEVPPNCIDLEKHPDACPHCLRVGCVHGSQRYDSGHSFHVDPCLVCHCPDDGGVLMCSQVPDCSSRANRKPVPPTNAAKNERFVPAQRGAFSPPTRGHKYPTNILPLYTEGTESDENDDYDYSPETTSSRPEDSSLSTESSVRSRFPTDARKELRQTVGTYEPGPEGTTNQTPAAVTTSSTPPEDQAASESAEQSARLAQTGQATEPSDRGHRLHGQGYRTDAGKLDRTVPGRNTDPKLQFSPTTSAPVNVREHHRQPQTLGRYQEENNDLHLKLDHQSVLSREEMDECCVAGENWASDHAHCSSMIPTRTELGSICWSVQLQCCLSSWRDRRCLAGLNSARRGQDCRTDHSDCSDSYRECCSCCALGLRLRLERGHCEAPRGLGETCGDALLSCCEGTDGSNGSTVEESGRPRATGPPRKVSEGPDRQSFSLSEDEDSENTLEETEGLEDMDECRVYEGLLCHHRCINTPGSYECGCFSGYALHQDGINCLPVRADEENILKEYDLTPTVDPEPTVMSTTPPHIPDPCEGNGPCAQRCTPVEGRPHCSCHPGFSLGDDERSCTDIDECLLSTHTCQAGESCTNTVGRFECRRQIVCPAGYSVRNDLCEDMDECTLGTHNCATGFECVNSAGSFSCRARVRCPGGFTPDTRGQCADIDECSTISQPCSPGFNCLNTVGSYTCQRKIILCGRGYHASPDGTRCIDTDECETGAHQCREDQLCHNLPGTYRCDCRTGYQYDMFRRACVDVNECWRYAGRLCAQTCENTPGSYQCSCRPGFTLSSDGKNCEDVNECLNSPCSQECVNVYGSFQCYCKQGFIMSEDGLTCKDVDECSQSVGHLCSYKCVNVPGSYNCVCPEHGYTTAPNQRSCLDVDECGVGAHNCTADETCFNIQGGFRCLSFSCPANYRRAADTRCDRISCADFLSCQNMPVRITYYQLTFQTNVMVPALIFRMGPSPAYSGDDIVISIAGGNEDGYFGPRKLNAYTGAIYIQRQLAQARDFVLHVEMKLWRQGTLTTFLARISVFVTSPLSA
ncbi:fibulin-2-like [Trichomycterus rosablanca]|uniref:fibulin-2-like n=1 Tax=Trichomycterus rosablanca TaxID=2290929 RepID=UPI002F358CAC